ncbi:histidine kinase [Thiomicrospira aerophila AL3]|uniref:Histidine kinase n=1 Tax=Thiomicrospira aerophila AL3 TaxID=717772 RepID=W0DQF3_9GAMM|nr:response regulator [Thiomicrospira aerophila]AHF00840.1 histidine kinase [Thiomicrospira aerophila AL3]
MRNLNILLVDDDLLLHRIQSAFINGFGHQAYAVAHAEDAITALKNQSFDLVLMDLIMPDINGFEMTRRLRSEGFKLPIVALSGNDTPADRQQAQQAGMNGYLTKPLRLDAFNQVINNLF